MYQIKKGNITQVSSGIIVHGCNAQSVMGLGVAKDLRTMYPEIYSEYATHLAEFRHFDQSPLGSVNFVQVTDTLLIANAITQIFYGRDGAKYVEYFAIREALETVYHFARRHRINDIHLPKIGTGYGGGEWPIIENIIKESLAGRNTTVWEL